MVNLFPVFLHWDQHYLYKNHMLTFVESSIRESESVRKLGGGGGTPLIHKPQIRWKMAKEQYLLGENGDFSGNFLSSVWKGRGGSPFMYGLCKNATADILTNRTQNKVDIVSEMGRTAFTALNQFCC